MKKKKKKNVKYVIVEKILQTQIIIMIQKSNKVIYLMFSKKKM